jgi:hypothetical protein
MPSKRISFHDFNRRLWLADGRDQLPEGALRRASGIAPELTGEIYSRWGSQFLNLINPISLYKFNGVRYSYDGTHLYANGAIVTYGGGAPITWNGSRLTFAVMPPQPGLPDYLFIIGGGNAIKIAPSLVGGNPVPVAQQVTQWGIDAPPDGMMATKGLQELTTIDTFVGSAHLWTDNSNATVSDSSASPYPGSSGDLEISTSGTPWYIGHTANYDLSEYADGTISLDTDIISFYLRAQKPTNIVWLWLTFRLGGTNTDYYRLVIQLVQNTNNVHTAGAQVVVTPDPDRWIQIAAAKSQFQRVGSNLALNWSDVTSIRFVGGDINSSNPTLHLDNFTMYGGFPLGAGPAALLGGSQYQYYVTFVNNTTGSESNPNGMETLADGTVNPPTPVTVNGVAVQAVNLSGIPTSTDPQVGSRNIYRSTADPLAAGPIEAFFLATIPDNVTTNFTDFYSDLPGQPIIDTPWQPTTVYSSASPTDYVYGGNGYYFKCTGAGTSAGSGPPTWAIPEGAFLGFWSPITQYLGGGFSAGNWVSFGGLGYYCSAPAGTIVQSSTPPVADPTNWTVLPTTSDGGVTWTWAGLNEVPHLGDQSLLLDNAPPSITYGDAVGPYQESMFWCRDSTPGRLGWAYSSPPGRPESVANQFAPTSDDDPTQKFIIFDYTLWLVSTKTAFQTDGQNPQIVFYQIMYATGTSNPFTVCAGQEGIYYQASDGIRMINRAGSILPGFDNIAPIERGQAVENVLAFTATIAAFCRNEIIFSNGTESFGLQLGPNGYVWRMLGWGFTALFYERDDNQILAGFNSGVYLYEVFGATNDNYGGVGLAQPINFEIQTPSQLLDEGQTAVIRRIFIDANLNGQSLTPTVNYDSGYATLSPITNSVRGTIELAFQQYARQFSLDLIGCLTARIQIFGIELDCAVTGSEVTQ